LWISTFSGISRFDLNSETFYNYSLDDGMQGLMYSEIAQIKTSGGLIIFGGNNGVTWFDPDSIRQTSRPPIVSFTNIIVDNTSIMGDLYLGNRDNGNQVKPLILSYNNNNFSIEYNGIQYDNPGKNNFAYQLLNYDKDWRHVNNSRSAFYFNIPPGDYTFQVKAANSHGVWSEPISMMITIDPPWWLTWWAYMLYGLILIGGVFAVDRIQRRRLINREREHAREKELKQAREIEKAYKELKNTQTQLIQSEKMASLGELTAGIAHEIQNPLNFVNNFSEVSLDLIEELKGERDKRNDVIENTTGKFKDIKSKENVGNKNKESAGEVGEASEDAALEEEILNDIYNNLEKIHFHGNRASSIVKGMLQHSRAEAKEKVSTDINELADEFLRLAYHGLRAKDKSFTAEYILEAEKDLPEINVISQDIGRVLLNLINNAFYAVSSKASATDNSGYKPRVSVTTKMIKTDKEKDAVEIRIKDNGFGIPASLKEKIFQPFFTTKPTGKGTGLGLSISYDIITKGHNGEMRVESHVLSDENIKNNIESGTEFIITIPK
jgi:signal transduction histidine kinase